jgi:hypothetical protein
MASEQSVDFFQKFLKVFYDILKPGLDLMADPLARNELLGSLGLPPNGNAPNIPASGGLQAYIDKADDEVEPFKLAGAIADLTSIMLAIEGLVQAGIAASNGEEKRTASEITTALLNSLTLEYLRRRAPIFHASLGLLNFIDARSAAAGGSANFITDYVGGFFKKLGEGLDNEGSTATVSDSLFMLMAGGLFFLDHFLKSKDIDDLTISSNYGFEGVSTSATPKADLISNRAFTYAIEAKPFGKAPLKVYNTLIFAPKDQGGVSLITQLNGSTKIPIKIDDKNQVDIEISGDGLFRIGNQAEAKAGPSNKFLITYTNSTPSPKKIALLNKPVVKFAFGTVKLGSMVRPDDLEVKGILNIHYQFGKGGLSGFPFSLLPDDIDDKFPLGIGYSLKRGFIIDGDGNIGTGDAAPAPQNSPQHLPAPAHQPAPQHGIETLVAKLLNGLNKRIPLHKSIGDVVGIEIINIKINVDDKFEHIEAEVSIDFWIRFGSPVVISISRFGLLLKADKRADSGGLFGYDLKPDIKWPTGAGIRINAGVVTGGGFLYLDVDKGEYFGALELSFQGLFALKAVGIINTIMPDGTKGFSLLIIITAEFSPIQLGFGFTLIGVGGLLGLNRRTEVEALRVGLKTNAIKSILFPEDVIGNISKIISDIKQIFPIKQDSFLIGLMGKIGWGTPTLVYIELGIILELPEPKILILGVVKMSLPTEEVALIKIQVNFLGVIDFQNQFVYFEARLYDSHLVGFPLTGSLALVVAWGSHSTFGISLGGFHPDFKDYPTVPTLPGAFRDMDRISIQLLSGDNPRFGIECYFAITSNSVQFGAKAELLAEGPMGFNLYGCLSLDVLFIFDPFSFSVRLEATLAIRHNTSILFGIHFLGILSGPTPWHIEGEVSFGLLFVTVTIGFEATWGDSATAIGTEKQDLKLLLEEELGKEANWKNIIPDYHNLHVTNRTLKEDEKVELLIHPFGAIKFSQRTLPLNFDIKKYGNKAPQNANETNFNITTAKVGNSNMPFTKEQELFAVGNFQPLSEAEKLSRKSFEKLESGILLNDTGQLSLPTTKLDPVLVNYELDYTNDDNVLKKTRITNMHSAAFNTLVRSAGVSEAASSWKNVNRAPLNAPVKPEVNEHKYTLASNENLKEFDANLRAGSYAEVLANLNLVAKQKPDMAENLQIVAVHELIN